ncbi:TIGR01457 family HAD-type hydrolase [Planomicrobium sp. Y74]|uniref:TIGR01457 family HAD-type hydrolase n=1 Tax=Planomicrobium sp. Y74 TaxID=2478977 RepID=UPI000EF4D695|nr:TIGR01457 family HAD-type hydrolase [Planomicrobium sp. Y74]RLQ85149.1 TIGR01457 family HAD-type hydrolase [Planomicrobium sp. Y74]
MKDYNVYCLDLDGTVFRGSELIPETADFIHRLQKKGMEPYYVTNNASMTQQQFAEKLKSFGIVSPADHIMTSAIAAAKYIKRWYPGKKVFMIGTDGVEEALKSEGIERVYENADIVLMGIDRNINFKKLATACLEVRKGAVFLSTNRDLAFPSERGFMPGNGAFTKVVSSSTGVEPVFIGKPEMHMLEAIKYENGCDKEGMVMVGDNYDTDIQAGIRFGIDTIHVNTGVTPMEEAVKKEVPPTYAIENLSFWEI